MDRSDEIRKKRGKSSRKKYFMVKSNCLGVDQRSDTFELPDLIYKYAYIFVDVNVCIM